MANTPVQLERQRRYRDTHREKLREIGRAYAERKRREAGMPAMGTEESRANRSNARKATGSEHGNWKGDDVGYFALHTWLNRNKERTGACEWCHEERRTTFANLSGEYRRDVTDFAELCYPCHKVYDLERLGKRAA